MTPLKNLRNTEKVTTPYTVKDTAKRGFIADVLAYHPRTSLYLVRPEKIPHTFCLYSELQAQKAKIEKLMSTITKLQSSLSDLQHKFEQTQQAAKLQIPTLSSTATPETNTVPSITNQSANNAEKKFNIVVYGIPECPQNTNRQIRAKKEVDNVIEALSKTDTNILSSDIKDLHQLGKYDHKRERPRPLLVKLLRSNMVLNILSSKSKLEAPIYIKPDMTLHERQKEKLLLGERRSLIDQGTERRHIKLRNDSIFVNNKLHCKVSSDNYKLEYVTGPAKMDQVGT